MAAVAAFELDERDHGPAREELRPLHNLHFRGRDDVLDRPIVGVADGAPQVERLGREELLDRLELCDRR